VGGDLPTYREALDAFRWNHVMDELGWSGRTTVNLAATIVDRHANGPDGGRTALIWIGESGEVRRLSFRELSEQSARFANLLARIGVRKGDRVAGLMPRVPETLPVMLGVLKAGAIHVPIFTGFGRDAVRYRLQHSGARVLCTTDTQRPLVPDDMEIATICLARSDASAVPGDYDFAAELARESPTFAPVPCGRDEPAVIIYTSGSTGQPKGCAVATNLLAAVWPYVRYGLDLRPDDVFWPTGDPGWGYGLCCYLPALAAGVTVVSVEATPRPEVLIAVLEAHAVSSLATTPTVLRSLMASELAASGSAHSVVRAISSCGEPLNGEVVEFFRRAWKATPMDHYGATEFGLPIGNHNGIAMEVKAGSMGLPAPGCVMAIVDEEGRELPPDEVGLIAQKQDADSRYWLRYWNDDAATAGLRRNGWACTGDLARRDRDGYFWFEGRSDDVIKSAGYRIGPFEIESAILRHPAVVEVAVVGRPDPLRGQIVKAFVVVKPGAERSTRLADEIASEVRTSLGRHQYPREIEFIDALPKTQTGKIQRFLLRQACRA
jgi:acetyl-CoA synthetase